MSFGFGVGDFLAVGKLAWDLYRKCYVVAKDAPKEFQELVGEIATLSQSIKILEDEVNNPESTLVRAGEDRARMMAEMMRRVEVTLRELEKFAMKYEQLANPKKAWRKEFWAKFKWSLDASNLEGLKNKLVYHNGVINLLLTSAGNSSLQRIESAHNRFEEKLSQIDHHLQKIGTQKDTTSPDTPILSVLQNPVLSATFMKNAEIGNRRWSAIGIDEWIQAGRWWLLKSQTKSLTTQGSSTQAYADLIKASWILRDVIVKHPQLNLLDPTMQCEAAVLAEEISRYLGSLEESGYKGMTATEIQKADLRIWETEGKRDSLQPVTETSSDAAKDNQHLWETTNGSVIMQCFAICTTFAYSAPCVILIIAHKLEKKGTIVVREQASNALLTQNLEALAPTLAGDIISIGNNKLRFPTSLDAQYTYLLMAAAKEFVCHCHFKYYDSDVLNAFALLYSRITGSKAVTEWILKNQQDETSAIPKRVLPRELRKLVEEVDWSDPYFPNISNAFSTSLLMWSAQNTHDEITLLLLKFRDVHITAMEIYQYTSLPGAASMGSIASFRLLASENGVDMDDKLVMRCLLAAAHEGQAAVVEALIDRPLFYPALGNIRNLWLPACVTIAEGHVVIAKRILQRIKQHLAVKTEDTNSPLEPSAEIQNMLRILLTLCAEKGNRKIIGTMWKLGMGQGPKYLNGTCKFNWDEFPYFKAWSLDFRTMRPLDAAAAGGHETIIQMFLEAGADPTFDVASVSCWPALLGAAQGGHERIVHQLIAAGADVNHVHGSGCGPGPEDGRVATALILAVEGGHRNIVKTLLENRARIENAPAQIDRGSRYDDWRLCNGGHSALILAVAIGDEEIVHQLLKAGADVEFDEDCSCQHPSGNQSRKGTSLSIAAERGNLSILQILLNAGATDKSYGALWKAVAEGQLPALNLLLSALYTCHNRYGSDARWASHGIIEAIRFNKGDSVILEILLRSLKMVTHTFIEDLHQSRCLRGAVSAGHAACARMLLKTGVDSTWGLADEASESLLWLAVASNSEEMVDILLPRVTDIRHIQGCLLRLLGWHDYHSIHSELKQHPLMICSSSIVTKLRDARDRLNQRAKVAAAPVCVEE